MIRPPLSRRRVSPAVVASTLAEVRSAYNSNAAAPNVPATEISPISSGPVAVRLVWVVLVWTWKPFDATTLAKLASETQHRQLL